MPAPERYPRAVETGGPLEEWSATRHFTPGTDGLQLRLPALVTK